MKKLIAISCLLLLCCGGLSAKEKAAQNKTPEQVRSEAAKMTADGYKFYLSANNVWLTDSVPARYLERTDNETT